MKSNTRSGALVKENIYNGNNKEMVAMHMIQKMILSMRCTALNNTHTVQKYQC